MAREAQGDYKRGGGDDGNGVLVALTIHVQWEKQRRMQAQPQKICGIGLISEHYR